MDRSRLAVVIPCHNEAATIGGVAGAAAAFGQVFVADDRSTDASRQAAKAAGAQVISANRPGYDGALEAGLAAAAGFEFVVTLDADGEHDPECLANFVAAFEAGAPLVLGVRAAPQRLAEHLIAKAGRRLWGIDDLLCGMKGYGAQVLAAWRASGAPLTVNMAPAVLWRKAGGDVAQVPVTGVRRVGRPRFGRAVRANLALLRAFRDVARLNP